MIRPFLACAALVAAALLAPQGALAGGTIEVGEDHSVTVGAGLRSAFTSIEDSNDFSVQSVRLYVNGQIHEKVKFTFNTECIGCVFGEQDPIGAGGEIDVLDAIAQFELSPEFNIWLGRMLTPADRIELNGPYYGLSWNQYTVPLLPSDQLGNAGLLGRDDGVTVWGTLGKVQYAAGLFDGVNGGPNTEDDSALFAGRVAINFLTMEANPAYYTSSTYFGGGGDIFTIGLSYQSQANGTGSLSEPGDFSALIVDALFEKPLASGGAITLEGEYKTFDAAVTAAAAMDPTCFCLFDGESYFVTAAYLFAGQAGIGRLQPYVRQTSNEPSAGESSSLTEFGVNYIINGHNARLNFNVTSGDAHLSGTPVDGDGFSFGVQVQI